MTKEINTSTVYRYSVDDTRLIGSQEIQENFNPISDYIEYYVYDLNNNILVDFTNGFPGYKLIDNKRPNNNNEFFIYNIAYALPSNNKYSGIYFSQYKFIPHKLF